MGDVRLHLVYRSTGRSNNQPRPPWFDKDVCLASAIRALLECGGPFDATFVNDGPIPAHRLAVMQAHGDIVALEGAKNRGSYRACIRVPEQRGWPDDDLVYFCEDDYLHLPHALATVRAAAEELPDAGFFNLYDHTDFYLPTYPQATTLDVAGNHHWRTAQDTNLTYGARVGAIRSQRWIHYIGTIPNTPRDKRIWRAVQRRGLFKLLPVTQKTWMASAVPALAAHVQTDFLPAGVDWEAVNDDAARYSVSVNVATNV